MAKMKQRIKNIKFSFNLALFLIFVVMFVLISTINQNFLNPDYLIGVMLRNIVEIGLMALPVTLVVITGGIDLSVGSILVLSAMASGMMAKSYGDAVGLIAALAIGTLCGLLNGLVIAKLKISPLVTTLATMFLFMGIARGLSLGDSVYSFKLSEWLGMTDIAGIPLQIYIYVLFAVVFFLLLAKTTLGRSLYAIGLNENATKYAGIKTDKIKIAIYVLSGIVCAIAGLIWLGRFTSIKYDAGAGLNLKVVTVIVLGGTSILGGYGDMKGTILATLIIALLNSGLTVLNIPIDTQTIVLGSVLVVSLIAYAFINDRVKKSKIVNIDVQINQDS